MNKVNKHGDDNCKYEFRYAREKLGSNNLIPVVMETEMKNQKFEWTGEFGAGLCNALYVDFSDASYFADESFDEKIDELLKELKNRIGDPLPPIAA